MRSCIWCNTTSKRNTMRNRIILRYILLVLIVLIMTLLGWMDDTRTFTIAEGLSALVLVALVPVAVMTAFSYKRRQNRMRF